MELQLRHIQMPFCKANGSYTAVGSFAHGLAQEVFKLNNPFNLKYIKFSHS